MIDGKFNVVFRGQIVKNFEESQVKNNLVKLFKTTPEAIEKLFSGEPVPVRKNLSYADAMKYQSALKSAGALAFIQDVEEEKKQQAEQEPEEEPKQIVAAYSGKAKFGIDEENESAESEDNTPATAPQPAAESSDGIAFTVENIPAVEEKSESEVVESTTVTASQNTDYGALDFNVSDSDDTADTEAEDISVDEEDDVIDISDLAEDAEIDVMDDSAYAVAEPEGISFDTDEVEEIDYTSSESALVDESDEEEINFAVSELNDDAEDFAPFTQESDSVSDFGELLPAEPEPDSEENIEMTFTSSVMSEPEPEAEVETTPASIPAPVSAEIQSVQPEVTKSSVDLHSPFDDDRELHTFDFEGEPSLAQAGVQLVPTKKVEEREVDTSSLSLANAGERILPEKAPESHPKPNIDHLKLVDD